MLQAQTANFEYQIRRYEAGDAMSLHSHSFSKISMVMQGAVAETAERNVQVCLPGSVATKPVGYEHCDEVAPYGLTTLAMRPRADGKFLHIWEKSLAAYAWWQNPALTRGMTSLYIALQDGLSESEIENITIEVLDALPSQTRKGDSSKPKWAEQELERIEHEHGQNNSILAIAEQRQLHPVYVSRTFRNVLGMPLSNYLLRRHIQQAALCLSSTRLPPAEIALDAGFADQAHMNRTFKAHFGITPLEYRRLMS